MLMDLHMHSNYSDGKNTPEEMIEAAKLIGYQAIAITDHVWKTSHWIPAYANHLNQLKTKFKKDIIIYSGIEAKVLTLNGDIDEDPSFDPLIDLVLGSIHRIPSPSGFYSRDEIAKTSTQTVLEHWLEAFKQLLKNPRVDILAHPLAELRSFGIPVPSDLYTILSEEITSSGKITEINVRYQTPDEQLIDLLTKKGAPMVVSSDSHSVANLHQYSTLIKERTELLPTINITEYLK